MKDDKWIITFELSTRGSWTYDEVKHSVEHALQKHFLSLPHKIIEIKKDENNGE